jgi:hypothetical protein
MVKLAPLAGCLSVAARLLVEVVLDAQVILHGGLVLEEPLAELAGHAAHGPVLVPRKNLVACHLFLIVWIRLDRHRFGGSGSFFSTKCKVKLYFFPNDVKILKVMAPLNLTKKGS